MEGQATTTEAASDVSTSEGASEATEAATTTETAVESESKGETLITGSDAGSDDVAATEAATETTEAAATETPATEETKPEESDDAAKAEEETQTETEEKAEGDKLDGLPEDFDWRDLATDEKSRNRLNQFRSMDDLAEFVREADSWRRKAVVPPGPKSTEDEVKRYHKMIGVPETPDGYQIEMAEDATDDDKMRVDRLRMAAHGVHVTPDQLKAMIEFQQAETAALEQREAAAAERQLSDAKTELSRTWGPDFQKNVGIATAAMKRAGADQFSEDWAGLELKDGTKIGNHPWTSQIFAKLGTLLGEAGVPGEIVPESWLPSESELMEMQSQPGYQDGTDKALIARVGEGTNAFIPAE